MERELQDRTKEAPVRQPTLEAATEEAAQRQKRKPDYDAGIRRLVAQQLGPRGTRNALPGLGPPTAPRRDVKGAEHTGLSPICATRHNNNMINIKTCNLLTKKN